MWKPPNNTALDIAVSEQCKTFTRYESYQAATAMKQELRGLHDLRLFLCRRCQGFHLRHLTERELVQKIITKRRTRAIQKKRREERTNATPECS